MKILIDIGHPSHVHFFKNAVFILLEKENEIKITARNKDVTIALLDAYNLDYEIVGTNKKGFFKKAINAAKIEKNIYNVCKKFQPDLLLGASGNFYITHVAKMIGKPSIIFEDSEPDKSIYWLCKPFATYFCTPINFSTDLGKFKHIRYKGYKELAYLHPNQFRADESVLDELGLKKNDRFILLRFVAWSAAHDVGHKGFSLEDKRLFVKELENYGEVYISSETELPNEFENHKLKIPPNKIHDLLYYAYMFVGDSQTMATEASILGIPTVRSNSFVGTMSNFKELEEEYGLMYSIKDPRKALIKALELQKDENLKQKWSERRKKLLRDKIDVTEFIVDLIERYPQSCNELVINNNQEKSNG